MEDFKDLEIGQRFLIDGQEFMKIAQYRPHNPNAVWIYPNAGITSTFGDYTKVELKPVN